MAVDITTNPWIFATQGDDASFETIGIQSKVKVGAIAVMNGSNAGAVELTNGNTAARSILKIGSLAANGTFFAQNVGWLMKGIYAKTLPSGCTVYVYLEAPE